MKYLSIIFSILILSACSGTKNANYGNRLSGSYYGEIPCADCEGIKTAITLNDNYTFQKSFIYLGKSHDVIKETGSWKAQNDSTILLNENGRQQAYRVKNQEGLEMLDLEGNSINSDMKPLYKLQKTTDSQSQEENMALKRGEGITFFATGNEPFWSFSVKQDKSISFNFINKEKPILIKDTETTYGDGSVFYTSKKNELEIHVFNFPCVDDMSGKPANYYVEAIYKQKKYTGCGYALSSQFELSGKWNLAFVRGASLEQNEHLKKPFIRFDAAKHRVSGSFSCNSFGGEYSTDGQSISFSKLLSTKMACQSMVLENAFSQKLEDVNRFEIKDGKLLMYSNNDVILSFER